MTTLTPGVGPASLRIRSLSKAFGGVRVADDIDLDVEAGQMIGIVGPNGAGKSTLFGMISGDVPLDSGTIQIDELDITRATPRARVHAGVGRTYQVPRPFTGMTMFESAVVAAQQGAGLRKDAAYAAAVDALEKTGLRPLANTLLRDVSLLDRKRAEIARALATGPRLLLLDEVAGGLTDLEVAALLNVIEGLRGQVTVLWIEHVLHAVSAVVDEMFCLAGGTIIARGAPDDVMNDERVSEVYLGRVDGPSEQRDGSGSSEQGNTQAAPVEEA